MVGKRLLRNWEEYRGFSKQGCESVAWMLTVTSQGLKALKRFCRVDRKEASFKPRVQKASSPSPLVLAVK